MTAYCLLPTAYYKKMKHIPRDQSRRFAFDADGKLYVATYGQGDVTVLGRDGSVLQRIRTPGMQPTNVCFGPPGEKQIYVTEYEKGTVERFDVDADGYKLFG